MQAIDADLGGLALERWRRLGLILAVLLGFGLRLAPVGRYVTPDEPAWVYRSIRFSDALAHRDWASLPNTGHPGVTTMWLGSAGVLARRMVSPDDSLDHLNWIRRLAWLAPENGEAFRHLAPFLTWGRVAVALVTVTALLAIHKLLTSLFGRRAAFLATVLLLFEPFLVGHSGLLHTDALLATFFVLTLLAALRGARRESLAVWWAVAGLFTALAVLTKMPGVVLLLVVPTVMVAGHLQSLRRDSQSKADRVSALAGRALLFAASFTLVVVVLYPALWSEPATILSKLRSFGGDHIRSVQRPIFFAGRMRHDPGPAFYPVVFLFRVSPLVIGGLVVGALRWPSMARERRFALLALVAVSVLFGVGLSVGAKKHGRYLLPALMSLNLAAALGVDAWLTGYGSPWQRRLTAAAVFLQLGIAFAFASHPLSYANPLFGGPGVANRLLPSGWGEDAGAAARHLNRLSDASELTVATDSVPSFASLFAGRTISLGSPDRATALADYVIGSSAEDQRADLEILAAFGRSAGGRTVIYTNTLPSRQAAYLSERARDDDLILLDADTPLSERYRGPATVVSAASLLDEAAVAERLVDAAATYDAIWLVASEGASPITADIVRRRLAAVAEPGDGVVLSSSTITQYSPRPSSSSSPPPLETNVFGGEMALVDAFVPHRVAWPGSVNVVLRWRATARPGADYRALLTLRDQGGHTWAQTEGLVTNEVYFPTSAWEAGSWCDQTFKLDLPPGIPPADYAVEISLYDRSTQARSGAVGSDGSFRGTRVPAGHVLVDRPHGPPDAAAFDPQNALQARLGPLTLFGFEGMPDAVPSGDHVSLSLFWEADVSPRMDYDLRLEMAVPGHSAELEVRQLLSPYPTSLWRAGDRFQTQHTIPVSPTLPARVYQVSLRLQPAEGAAPTSRRADLGKVEVLPRERSFSLPDDIPNRVDLSFGDSIHLRGYDLDRAEAEPGGELPLTLYWQADASAGPTKRSYTLFVHLLGPDGLPHGQVDRVPGAGAAPTSSWAPGQVVISQIELPVAGSAPPGDYRIALGFYDPHYGERLSLTDDRDPQARGDQVVLPERITIARGYE